MLLACRYMNVSYFIPLDLTGILPNELELRKVYVCGVGGKERKHSKKHLEKKLDIKIIGVRI